SMSVLAVTSSGSARCPLGQELRFGESMASVGRTSSKRCIVRLSKRVLAPPNSAICFPQSAVPDSLVQVLSHSASMVHTNDARTILRGFRVCIFLCPFLCPRCLKIGRSPSQQLAWLSGKACGQWKSQAPETEQYSAVNRTQS